MSLNDEKEFFDPETACSSGMSHVPSQLLSIPSESWRNDLPRFLLAARDTELNGYRRKRF